MSLPGYQILFTVHAFVSQGQLSLDACLHFGIPSNFLGFCPITLPIPSFYPTHLIPLTLMIKGLFQTFLMSGILAPIQEKPLHTL
jgi:hypothetical protein